jgi:hypothetical protein
MIQKESLHPTSKDRNVVEKYVMQNKDNLISNMYMNILVGYKRFAKPYGFFKKLSEQLRKPAAKSKQMYLQMEQDLFVNVLGVPKEHYDLYVRILKMKSPHGSNEVREINMVYTANEI